MNAADQIERAAILGAGTMGAGIAQVCAQAGIATRLYDLGDDLVGAGLARIVSTLDRSVAKERIDAAERERILARVAPTTELARACDGAHLIVEAIPEDLELKRSVLAEVERLVSDDCLLATNTSSIPITSVADALERPGRFLGLHFFNPPAVMKLLEIVVGEATRDASRELARALAERLGKDPIVVADSPGFASSRLGVALGLEAIRMLEEGVASAADIDTAMRLGYRHPMGPLELTDLVGLDVRLHIADHLAQNLDAARFAAPGLLRDKVAEGKLGKKTGEGFYRWEDGKPS